MKNCPNCGHEIDDDISFCSNCGVSLNEKTDTDVCSVCGAQLSEGVKFCGKCGARVIKSAPVMPERCDACGAVISNGAAFCSNCGKAKGGAASYSGIKRGEVNGARKKSATETVEKIKAFENKHCVITNALIAVCAIIFVFVSLFCPVKMTQANVMLSDWQSVSIESVEIKQSVFQVFDSLGYIALDMSDAEDVEKVDGIVSEYKDASLRISEEFEVWLKIQEEKHGAVTQEKRKNKYKQLTEKYMSEVNQLAYAFAYTTVGALNNIYGDPDYEFEMDDMLDTMRAEAVTALVFALIVSVAQVALAALSLAFAIMSILGIVRKRQTQPRAFFMTAAIISTAGLVALAVSPLLAPGGAMLAVALVSVLVWFAYVTARAFIMRKNIQAVIKNVIITALTIISFFLLCSAFVKVTVGVSFSGLKSSQKAFGSLGIAIETVIMYALMPSMAGHGVDYSGVSLGNAVATLVLGIAAMSVVLAALLASLDRLYKNAEKTSRFDALVFVGTLLLVLFAIVPAIIGAADKLPDSEDIACTIKFAMRSHVYYSIAFMIAATFIGAAVRPNIAPSAPVEQNASAETNIAETASA